MSTLKSLLLNYFLPHSLELCLSPSLTVMGQHSGKSTIRAKLVGLTVSAVNPLEISAPPPFINNPPAVVGSDADFCLIPPNSQNNLLLEAALLDPPRFYVFGKKSDGDGENLWNSFLIHWLNCLKTVEVISQANSSFGPVASSYKLQLAFRFVIKVPLAFSQTFEFGLS